MDIDKIVEPILMHLKRIEEIYLDLKKDYRPEFDFTLRTLRNLTDRIEKLEADDVKKAIEDRRQDANFRLYLVESRLEIAESRVGKLETEAEKKTIEK